MTAARILHQTAHRLRAGIAPDVALDGVRARVGALPGVRSVRVNATLRSVAIRHDGEPATRAALLDALESGAVAAPLVRRTGRATAAGGGEALTLAPLLLAASVPLLPRSWRQGAALGAIATRVFAQSGRLRDDPAAVLLDAASLAALTVSGQPLVVSTSVLLRWLSERLSVRLVDQADALLDQLLPTEAAHYPVVREPGQAPTGARTAVRALRAGDRIRLVAGDVVPVDGCAVGGAATLAGAAHPDDTRDARPGAHVAAGERLSAGTLELRAEADAASSRLERMRAHVRHAIGSRDPAGRLAPGLERLLSLPLTAAALVFGLTGDTARAAAMLQANPGQGLDLALPVAREAALYSLARCGLLTSGLEAIERLASARTFALQDTGVMTNGRWSIESVRTEPGGDPAQVRRWLAALADTPLEVLDVASFPDRLVRQWVRHGALLRVGEHDLHLASRRRLQQVWGWTLDGEPPAPGVDALRRELAVVAAGRVVARVVLASALRPGALARIDELSALGVERIVLFAEDDGSGRELPPAGDAWCGSDRLECVPDDAGARVDCLAAAVSDGTPVVIAHTVLRDLVPPGSLSLCPMDADAGAHGVLLGDPLASLVAARRAAQLVRRRLRLQQGAAVAANSALMTAAALRWLPPMGTALLHHGFALLLLLDSLRVERIDAPKQRPTPAARASTTTRGRPRAAARRKPRSEIA